MRIFFLFVLLGSMICCFGCGKQLAVSGKVVFSDDKSPAPNGVVCFDTGTNVSRGVIKDGAFRMGTLKDADGLLPGKYKIYFAHIQKQTGVIKGYDGDADEPIYTLLIDNKYTKPETSGFALDVTKSTKELVFELDRNPVFPKRQR